MKRAKWRITHKPSKAAKVREIIGTSCEAVNVNDDHVLLEVRDGALLVWAVPFITVLEVDCVERFGIDEKPAAPPLDLSKSL